jgi:N-methylhydantoinase A
MTTEEAFADAHRALYGFALDAVIELVTVRVEAAGRMPPPVRSTLGPGSGIAAYARREVHFASGAREVPMLDRASFGAGDRFVGPAIVTQLDATTLVPPGWSGQVHASGALLLTRD